MNIGTLTDYCEMRGLNYRSIYPRVRFVVKSIKKVNKRTYLYDYDELDAIIASQDLNSNLEKLNNY